VAWSKEFDYWQLVELEKSLQVVLEKITAARQGSRISGRAGPILKLSKSKTEQLLREELQRCVEALNQAHQTIAFLLEGRTDATGRILKNQS
jgi:hypothetical protein